MRRYLRFEHPRSLEPRWGERNAEGVELIDRAPWLPGARQTGERIEKDATAALRHLAPAEPTKILALAFNYSDLFDDAQGGASASGPHFSDPAFEPLIF